MSFYRKHRPQKFSDLIGQDHIRDTLIYAFKNKQINHAYLFTGPRGTGKTSTARLIAKALNCLNLRQSGEPCNSCDSCDEIVKGKSIDIIEIDAASNRGIEEIREIRENVKFSPVKSKYKVYIIDEVHMLTREAFNALLKTLEEPPAHAIFILATTEAHKVPATIISRTLRFDFVRINKADLIIYLKKVAKAENIKINDEALDLLAVLAEGGHRDAVSFLEQASIGGNVSVEVDSIRNILGITEKSEIFQFLRAIFNANPEEGLKIAQNLFSAGKNMSQFNKEVIEAVRKIMLYRATGKIIFDETKDNIDKIIELSKYADLKRIEQLLDIFIERGLLLKDVSYPLMPVEMATILACSLFGEKQGKIKKPMRESDINEHVEKSDKESKPDDKGDVARLGSKKKDDKNLKKTDKDLNRAENKEKGFESDNDFSKDIDSEQIILSSVQWNNVVSLTKKENNSLAALLRDAKPIAFGKDQITLGVKFQFHKDKISEVKNIRLIERFAEEVLGKKCRVACKISDLKKKVQKPASDDELLQAADEIFG